MLFDTHAHVNFKDYKNDVDAVLTRAREKAVAMINVGSQLSTSERAVEMAEKYPRVFAAVGLHPIHLEAMLVVEDGVSFQTRAEQYDFKSYHELAVRERVVAIGECGLDYFHIDPAHDIAMVKDKQKAVLHDQIELANNVNKPLILHCRGSRDNYLDAYADLLHELKKNLPKQRGVVHCFGGDEALAEQYVELGFYIGFTGVLTFDRSGRTSRVVSQIPAERILAETDCPYLTPEPFRGQRNEPMYVEYVVNKIAEVRQLTFEDAARLTTQNAKTLFNVAL
jgi:TatD DNase family protein